ncbi:hypothetical protein B0T19DRAFT_420555 [Cercophora scortea]|uniref:Uncharacterized protein n=1 Tax=Cercophora scortea TaxID=314031 RepID=A0AAE0IL86_9PEZI|nr:hypothetical protein B0T19DRAFT_420555 [Cercophora scortea]
MGQFLLRWLWAVVMFFTFVGKWMIVTSILSLAGDGYCPAKVKESIISGEAASFVASALSVALKYFGLAP